MACLRRVEEIEAWQAARELTRAIYAQSAVGMFAKDFALRDQIRRAAISTMSNIAEGFERGGSTEFAQFLAIAKGSAGEIGAQLYVALDQGYISEEDFSRIRDLVASTQKLIGGFMKYLRTSDIRGPKFKRR